MNDYCDCRPTCKEVKNYRQTNRKEKRPWCRKYVLPGDCIDYSAPMRKTNTKLLSTCKMIYFEARPFLYLENTFKFFNAIDLWDFIDKVTGFSLVPVEPLPFFGVHINNSVKKNFANIRITEKLFTNCPKICLVSVNNDLVVLKNNLSDKRRYDHEGAYLARRSKFELNGQLYNADSIVEAKEMVSALINQHGRRSTMRG